MGMKNLKNKISVDLFVFSSEYFDLASISPVVTKTGGSLYYFPKYNGI